MHTLANLAYYGHRDLLEVRKDRVAIGAASETEQPPL
jgi:hypothetical protein